MSTQYILLGTQYIPLGLPEVRTRHAGLGQLPGFPRFLGVERLREHVPLRCPSHARHGLYMYAHIYAYVYIYIHEYINIYMYDTFIYIYTYVY